MKEIKNEKAHMATPPPWKMEHGHEQVTVTITVTVKKRTLRPLAVWCSSLLCAVIGIGVLYALDQSLCGVNDGHCNIQGSCVTLDQVPLFSHCYLINFLTWILPATQTMWAHAFSDIIL